MEEVYQVLKKLEISYEQYSHPAVYTVEEAEKEIEEIEGEHTKNLFLRDEKGRRHYLVILPAKQKANLEELALYLNEKRLSFASSERLERFLGLEPGSVSPFGLINDKDCCVRVIIEEKLKKAEKIGFHPNKNTATIVLCQKDFQKFLDYSGNLVSYFSIS